MLVDHDSYCSQPEHVLHFATMVATIKIAPSILSADFARLGEEVREAEEAGAHEIHVDVMDGHFVPNITIGPLIVAALRPVTHLPLDVHLMIEMPDRFLEAFAQAGANILTVHIETCTHVHRTLQAIKSLGISAGVALNPGTPAQSISEIIADVDRVLVMTVNPGFGGQSFIARTLPKIELVREMIRSTDKPIDLSVDGGISPETVGRVVEAGANHLVAGNAVFGGSAGIAAAISNLQRLADQHATQ